MSAGSLQGAYLDLNGLSIKGVPFNASGSSGVASIQKDTVVNGAITFAGAGVAQSGSTFTFSGAGAGVSSVAGGVAPATGAITLQGAGGITIGGAGGSGGTITITQGAGGSGNVVANTSTTSATALEWVAGVYTVGDIVYDSTSTPAGEVYVCSATTTGTDTAPHLNAPAQWNLLSSPGAGGGSGNVVANTSTTSATALEWVAGVYNVGDIVSDATSTPAGQVYVCSATTAGTDTAPHLNAPAQWNLLSSPGAGSPTAGTMVLGGASLGTEPTGEWVSGTAYVVGNVVYSLIAPYNWFVCYLDTVAPHTTDPQNDVNAGTGGIGTYWEFLAPGVVSQSTSPVVRSGSFTVAGQGTPPASSYNFTITALPSTGAPFYPIVSQGGAGSPVVQVYGCPPIGNSGTTLQVLANTGIANGTVLNYIIFGTL